MTTRFVFQATEKISAICAIMHRAARLPSADFKALAAETGIPYSTLKSSIRSGRFSPETEEKLREKCRFDPEHTSWVDNAVSEPERRTATPSNYRGRDTLDRFHTHLIGAWGGASASFRVAPREYWSFDPHMVRHELSDLGQATPIGSEIALILSAYFEPFFHRSGIMFGFRKAAIAIEFQGGKGAHACTRLGHPDEVMLGDAVLRGDGITRQMRWTLHRQGDEAEVLSGEYATCEHPFVKLVDYENGTALTSTIQVNLFDRTTFGTPAELDVSANKQAMIEQIFASQLPVADAHTGWIPISRQELVVARFG